MWNLETNWYEIVIRTVCVFSFLFILMRIWGKKHFGELAPVDFLILLIMSEAVQNALISNDKSLSASFISVSTMFFLNIFMNKLTFRFRIMEKILEGTPKVLIKNGEVDEAMLTKQGITDQELHEALRMQGVLSVREVFLAVMETNGTISVIKN